MQGRESEMKHGTKSIAVRDSRNRRVEGISSRNRRFYSLLWTEGRNRAKKMARRFPLLNEIGFSRGHSKCPSRHVRKCPCLPPHPAAVSQKPIEMDTPPKQRLLQQRQPRPSTICRTHARGCSAALPSLPPSPVCINKIMRPFATNCPRFYYNLKFVPL